jgi:hypothetical protein
MAMTMSDSPRDEGIFVQVNRNWSDAGLEMDSSACLSSSGSSATGMAKENNPHVNKTSLPVALERNRGTWPELTLMSSFLSHFFRIAEAISDTISQTGTV